MLCAVNISPLITGGIITWGIITNVVAGNAGPNIYVSEPITQKSQIEEKKRDILEQKLISMMRQLMDGWMDEWKKIKN